ncbi:MAG: ABC transporter permease [Bacteroidales bacterium]|nr:ABC transporter permease [Bacteroidales bacterium]MCF8375432.1 ABC transporter permease [Bacteroidales bacterium]MCF8400980.1 ABC transporter permease [Bacteroidales bacterium]
MICAHIKTALRSFLKNKGYVVINILGLAIGMAMFFLIALYVKDEITADKFHKNLENIYRIETDRFANTPMRMKKLMGEEIPEVEKVCRMSYGQSSGLFELGEKSLPFDDMLLADPNFFEIFSFELLRGDPATVLSNPYSLVISESESERIFGAEDPIGKTLLRDQKTTFQITGVMKDIPPNSSIFAGLVGNLEVFPELNGHPGYLEDYNDWSHITFLLLSDNHKIEAVSQKISKHLNDEVHAMMGRDDFTINWLLRPMEEVYLKEGKRFDFLRHGSLSYIYIYSAVGLFILFIAVVNFINLATATASRRSREIGLKKVIGAGRPALIRQFLTESVLISLLALLIAVFLFELLVPVFNRSILAELSSSALFNPGVMIVAVLFSILIGILAGLYPAFYLSRQQPASILKGEKTSGRKGIGLRRALIVFQFTISVILIVASLVIYRQMRFARNYDLGFNKDQVLYFYKKGGVSDKFEEFKAELKSIPEVQHVGASSHIPGYAGMSWGRKVDTVDRRFAAITCNPEFLDVLELELVDGRNFYEGSEMDIHKSYIVNETLVKEFGLKQPVGTSLADGSIIGVVKDFSFVSIRNRIGPLALAYVPSWNNAITVRISPQNVPSTIDQIEKTWESFASGFPFDYGFVDQAYDRLYRTEERLARLFGYFSALAVFIAGMGLAGLALFSARQRTREIGVRKVFGANRLSVVGTMLREFAIWVALANVIAWPVAFLLMNDWLERFAYHIFPQLWMFLLAAVLAFLVAFVTVSWHAFRAASANPVDSLRYE